MHAETLINAYYAQTWLTKYLEDQFCLGEPTFQIP